MTDDDGAAHRGDGLATGGEPAPAAQPQLGRPDVTSALAAAAAIMLLTAAAVRRSLELANADSLLYGLISTEQLTPFYWGQDRLANVVPTLAWPVQDITWNYLLQTSIISMSFFALVMTFSWFHASRTDRDVSWGVVVTASTLTATTVLLLLTQRAVYVFVLEQQYALSTLLYLLGLGALSHTRPSRRILGGAAILTATLIIPSVVLLAPAAVVVGRGQRVFRRAAAAMAVSGAAFVVVTVASRALVEEYPYSEEYSDFSRARLRIGLERAANSIVDSTHRWAVLAAAILAVAALVAGRRHADPTLRLAYVIAPAVAVGWTVLFSSNAWVERNQFEYRYYFPAYAAGLLVLAGSVTEVCSAIAQRATARPRVPVRTARAVAAAGAVVAAAVAVPVIRTTDVPAVDEGDEVVDIADTHGADLVAGDYWRVWPAMFAARATGDRLIAVAERADPLQNDIRALAASSDGTVKVLCIGVDQNECLNDLVDRTETAWSVVSVRSADPLVLEFAISG